MYDMSKNVQISSYDVHKDLKDTFQFSRYDYRNWAQMELWCIYFITMLFIVVKHVQ